MQHQWKRQRDWSERPDGQRRWDRAYQLLGEWTKAGPPTFTLVNSPPLEKPDESGHLSSCLDTKASRGTHH
jgi:hypothetical protein